MVLVSVRHRHLDGRVVGGTNTFCQGVTPFASILKHIWYRQKKGTLGSLKRVEFFWVCRDAPSFGWFQTLLQEVEAAQADRECMR